MRKCCFGLVLALLLSVAPVRAEVRTCGPVGDDSACVVRGVILAVKVDDERVLIAVDAESAGVAIDGRVDHLFLFSRMMLPDTIGGRTFPGSVWINRRDGRATIHPDGAESISLLFAGTNHSHYVGFGEEARIEDLTRIEREDECDHNPGSCWSGRGWRITFPS